MPIVANFTPVFPFTIDTKTMDPNLTTRQLYHFADDLMETLDELYDDDFCGATGNTQQRTVTAFFKDESTARDFARMWHSGTTKVMREAARRRFQDDDSDIPF